ncbi:MAG TPA: cyanophycinase [Bryobacteraceae bacterium]|jgi:cyanophycinase|nr:cyanophycinase [Bryobacteraceae bacterium]
MRKLAGLLPALLLAGQVGPDRGSLLVVGGGELGPEIKQSFLALAGGADAYLVVIPTAGEEQNYGDDHRDAKMWRTAGFRDVKVLHTRDRAVADTEGFATPLGRARAVWFSGGRQWRLVDSYMGTRTQREIEAVLERGGVIGGSSAGATIQGSYLVRGAREGNTIMMAPGYEKGFGYLKNVAIDQHLLKRKRERDLVPVVLKHPELLGIGIDEGTAVVVKGDRFDVIGVSKVAVYEHAAAAKAGGFYFLNPGEGFDLRQRRRVAVLK